MNIILLSSKHKQTWSCSINGRKAMWMASFASIFVLSGVFYLGFYAGKQQKPDELVALEQEVQTHREALDEVKRVSIANVDAMARRIAKLQAYITRLDALGERLVDLGGLDKGEFDFASAPALGGPEGDDDSYCGQDQRDQRHLQDAIGELADELENREAQLTILEHFIKDWSYGKDAEIAGRPIEKGWISSFFGMRADPFSGKPQFHKGIDFAGKLESEIKAVASGVVTWSGERYGYGNMVEINHGNGYVTRYAHNSENKVKAGDMVERGQIIATMGSSGRSTGPHVHFEVMKNGRAINPIQFVNAAQAAN